MKPVAAPRRARCSGRPSSTACRNRYGATCAPRSPTAPHWPPVPGYGCAAASGSADGCRSPPTRSWTRTRASSGPPAPPASSPEPTATSWRRRHGVEARRPGHRRPRRRARRVAQRRRPGRSRRNLDPQPLCCPPWRQLVRPGRSAPDRSPPTRHHPGRAGPATGRAGPAAVTGLRPVGRPRRNRHVGLAPLRRRDHRPSRVRRPHHPGRRAARLAFRHLPVGPGEFFRYAITSLRPTEEFPC